ncbi:hypothetical protein QE152_g28425 [Popillia japonica]|uniref:PiggyBac transposable element-derived protein domain-containing protein n=1 Tax=Popillia japonica TaxID=7064 RepID=A0AAW1JKL0_POPJA
MGPTDFSGTAEKIVTVATALWRVDNLDKLDRTYSSKRKTKRRPMVVFYNTLDTGAYNALVIWMTWKPNGKNDVNYRRRVFLRQLAFEHTEEHIQRKKQCRCRVK